MNKYFRSLLAILLILGFCCLQPSQSFAVDNVEISIYYEKIEEVIDLDKVDIDSLNMGNGNYIKYSTKSTSGNYAYLMKRTKVSSEKELLEAMGVSSEKDLKYGQQCLLEAYRGATSDSMKARAGASYLPSVELDLFDTSYNGKDDKYGYSTNKNDTAPNIRRDFWPCSTSDKKRISVSDVRFKYESNKTPSGKDNAYTTVFHEYGHFMDQTTRESGSYGLDGTHYINEITEVRSSFMEGWAEYNEMIENEKVAQYYIDHTKNFIVESKTEAGSYTNLSASNATYDQLLRSESINAVLLYRLSQLLGEDAITQAFVDSRYNTQRDMRDLVKVLVKENSSRTDEICKVIDEVFLGKASNEEMLEMVGDSKAAKDYVENRTSGKSGTSKGDSDGKPGIKEKVKGFFANIKEKLTSAITKLIDSIKSIFSNKEKEEPTETDAIVKPVEVKEEENGKDGNNVIIETESNDPFAE